MNNRIIRVGITHGDTNGIGYELIFKAFENPEIFEICTPVVYGSPKVATYHRNALGINANFSIINSPEQIEDGRMNMIPVFDEEIKVELGVPSEEANFAAARALDRAITDYKEGRIDVLVTCPVNNDNFVVDGYTIPDNIKYVESSIGEGRKGIDVLMNKWMRMALMTDKMALKDVSDCITEERIIEKVATFVTTLRRDMRISNPRVAVLALNPGHCAARPGKEESEAIVPALEKLVDAGVCAFGPYQADEFFGNAEYRAFDGVLAMYHDQGLAPLKAIDPENNVHYLGGLPLISTAVDLAPGYDIAGQGKADGSCLLCAVYHAIDGFRNRNNFEAPYANPLPKLYHERRDESEKVRFSIPKKHENDAKERQKQP